MADKHRAVERLRGGQHGPVQVGRDGGARSVVGMTPATLPPVGQASVEQAFAADPARAAAVQAGVEQAALDFRLDASGAARLGQAVEEVFVHVATQAPGSAFELQLRDRHHAVEARLHCRLPSEELHWFNLTRPIDVEDTAALGALGLLLASRLVDRLSVDLDPDGGVRLVLEQSRQYSAPIDPAEPEEIGLGDAAASARLVPADADGMAALAGLFRRRFGIAAPWAFEADGLAIDLAAAGELSALVARGGAGRVLGGVAWTARSARLIEVLGPVSARDDAALAGRLVEGVVRALAGTTATMIFSEERGPGFPSDEFDCLGQLGSRPLHYRALGENVAGEGVAGVAWADAASRPFLEVFYEALGLDRDIRDIVPDPAPRRRNGLLAAEVDRLASRVTLRPLIDGVDLPTLIAAHVDRFADEGLDDFRFETDHGVPWQGGLGYDLMRAGFSPRVVLPLAARGDVVVWERDWMPL